MRRLYVATARLVEVLAALPGLDGRLARPARLGTGSHALIAAGAVRRRGAGEDRAPALDRIPTGQRDAERVLRVPTIEERRCATSRAPATSCAAT